MGDFGNDGATKADKREAAERDRKAEGFAAGASRAGYVILAVLAATGLGLAALLGEASARWIAGALLVVGLVFGVWAAIARRDVAALIAEGRRTAKKSPQRSL